MEYFAVTGGRPLAGEVRVHGAKNSALPILAATLLVRGESVVHNCPALTDIQTALDILSCLGCRVRRTGETVTVDAAHLTGAAIPDGLMGRMRASVLFLGALLARQGEASAWGGGPSTCTSAPFRPWVPRWRRGGNTCASRLPGWPGGACRCPSPAWGPRRTPCWPPAGRRG